MWSNHDILLCKLWLSSAHSMHVCAVSTGIQCAVSTGNLYSCFCISSSVFGHLTYTCLPYQQLYNAERKKKPRILIMFEKVDFTSKEGKGGKLALEGVQYISFQPGVDDYNSSFKKLMESLRKKGVYVTFSFIPANFIKIQPGIKHTPCHTYQLKCTWM